MFCLFTRQSYNYTYEAKNSEYKGLLNEASRWNFYFYLKIEQIVSWLRRQQVYFQSRFQWKILITFDLFCHSVTFHYYSIYNMGGLPPNINKSKKLGANTIRKNAETFETLLNLFCLYPSHIEIFLEFNCSFEKFCLLKAWSKA